MVSENQAVEEILEQEHYIVVTELNEVVFKCNTYVKAQRYCDDVMDSVFDMWCNCDHKWYAGVRVIDDAVQLTIVKNDDIRF